MNTGGELASSRPAHPLPEAGSQAGNSQSWQGAIGFRDSIIYQTASRLPVANQVFLGSWMVDTHQEGRSQTSAPQRRHMVHLKRCSGCTPRKPSGWDWGGNKTYCLSGRLCSPSIWSPEVLRPGKGTKREPNQVCAFEEYPKT